MQEAKFQNFYAGDLIDFSAVREHFTGENPEFLTDCRHVLSSPDDLGDLEKVGERYLKNELIPSSFKHLLNPPFSEADAKEKQRLYDQVRLTVFLTLFLHAVRNRKRSKIDDWLRGLHSCDIHSDTVIGWERWIDSPQIWLQDMMTSLPPELSGLISWLWNREKDDENALAANAPLKPQVSMFALGWSEEADDGYRCILTLEKFAEGRDEIHRHPTSLFLPCDVPFLKALDDACSYVRNQGFDWSSDSNIRKWNQGAIRWRLHRPDMKLETATGGSIGGAMGTGLILLLQGEVSDRIGITAGINENGGLTKVDDDSVHPKALAALKHGLNSLIVCEAQGDAWEAEFSGQAGFKIHGMDTALKAAKFIAARSGPRRVVRDQIYQESRFLKLLANEVGGRQ